MRPPGVAEQHRQDGDVDWRELCIYRHPEGYTSRRAKRFDWHGATPCPVRYQRAGQSYECGRTELHKHVQHQSMKDGPMPERDRYAGYLLHFWEPLQAQGPDLVVITEGEKDAAAVRDAGYLAASYLGGSGKAGDADYRDVAGKTVVVWGDDDADGRQANAWVVRRAWEAGATQIYLVPEPGDETGYGAADSSLALRHDIIASAIKGADLADREPPVPESKHSAYDSPGRPREYSTDEYIVHQHNARPQYWWSTLSDLGIPEHLRPDWQSRGVYQDAIRILTYQGKYVARAGNDVYLVDQSAGLWQMAWNGRSGSAVLALMHEARRQAEKDLQERLEGLGYPPEEYHDAVRTMRMCYGEGRRHGDTLVKEVTTQATVYPELYRELHRIPG